MRYAFGDQGRKMRRQGAYPQQAAVERLIDHPARRQQHENTQWGAAAKMIRACARLFIDSRQIIFCLATSTIVLSFDS